MATTEAVVATGMDAVYYMTKDFNRARSFYERTLGLKPSWEMSGEGNSFVEYELPDGTTFGLGHMPGSTWHRSGGIFFSVPDVPAALEAAKAAGAAVDFDFMDLPACHMAWVQDTEGNSLCLHRRK